MANPDKAQVLSITLEKASWRFRRLARQLERRPADDREAEMLRTECLLTVQRYLSALNRFQKGMQP
jgi:hypothetical protein